MRKKEIKVISPPNIGWLEYELNSQEVDYVWKCIENKKKSIKHDLVGNISSSFSLIDRGDWFYINTIMPLIKTYKEQFGNLGRKVPIATRHAYHLNRWWVNYQKQNEFNPIHNHTGIYSFVIWMKIPYDCKKQNQKDIARLSNSPSIGQFQFKYSTILGNGASYEYDLSPHYEGTMLFFPSLLDHQVYPFYDCDEDRISVSGNILVDINKKL